MSKNTVIGIVVVIALLVLGWWYWAFMMPSGTPALIEETASEDTASTEKAFSLTGIWRSTEDANWTRTFFADGTVMDRYGENGSTTLMGNWYTVDDPGAEQAEFSAVQGMRTIKIEYPEEVMYFAILELSGTELSMTLLGGNGSTLSFVRVP